MFSKKRENSARGKGFRSLTAKLLVSIGLVVTVICLVAGIVIMFLVRDSVNRLTSDELSARSQAASTEIERFFERYYEMSRQLSLSSQTETLLSDVHPGEKFSNYEELAPMLRTLRNIKRADSDAVLSLWVADFDSDQLVDSSGQFPPDGWSVEERPWYEMLMDAGQTVITEPYEDTASKSQVVSVITPVYGVDGRTVGAAGIDFALDALVATMGSRRLGESGFYLMTSASGTVIYHPDVQNIGRPLTEIDLSSNAQEALLTYQEGSIVYSSQGVQSHGYLSSVGDTGWMVATGLPAAEFTRSYQAIRVALYITFGLTLAGMLLALILVSQQIVRPLKGLTRTANLIADGDLDVTVQVGGRDEIGRMGDAINRTVVQLRRYLAYIAEITHTLEGMAQGDMRIKLEEDYVGEFAAIRGAFDNIAVSLNGTLSGIRLTAEQVSQGADQVSSGAQALASGSAEQAATVEELNATVSEMSSQAVENAERVRHAARQLEEGAKNLTAGNDRMAELTGAMNDISAASGQIASITKVIEDIAFQTNILALNAAIEAARAGAAGKGFAVVADEVRNLAAKSAEAAHQTAGLIEQSVEKVARGSEMADETARILRAVGEDNIRVVGRIAEIERITTEQAAALEQIKEGLSLVSAVVQTNAATAEENSATSEEMSAQAATLRAEVGGFRLEDEEEAGVLHPTVQPVLDTDLWAGEVSSEKY